MKKILLFLLATSVASFGQKTVQVNTSTNVLTSPNASIFYTANPPPSSGSAVWSDITGAGSGVIAAGTNVVNTASGLTALDSMLKFSRLGLNATGVSNAGIQSDIWIAVRGDSLTGSGTKDDPYDGSTQADVNAIFYGGTDDGTTLASPGPNIHWHLAPGNYNIFAVNGATLSAGGIQSGWTIEGSGIGVTTITLTGGSPTGPAYYWFQTPSQTTNYNYITIRDLTFTVSYAGSPYTTHYAVGNIGLQGSNILFKDCEFSNYYGDQTDGYEQFSCATGWYGSGNAVNNRMDRVYTHTSQSGANYTNGPQIAGCVGAWITNCKDDGSNHGSGFTGCTDCISVNNETTNNTVIAFYVDSGDISNLLMANNVFRASSVPVLFNGAAVEGTLYGAVIANNFLISSNTSNSSYAIQFNTSSGGSNVKVYGNTAEYTGGGTGFGLLRAGSSPTNIQVNYNTFPGTLIPAGYSNSGNITYVDTNTAGSWLTDLNVTLANLTVTGNVTGNITFTGAQTIQNPSATAFSALNIEAADGNSGLNIFHFSQSWSPSGLDQPDTTVVFAGGASNGLYFQTPTNKPLGIGSNGTNYLSVLGNALQFVVAGGSLTFKGGRTLNTATLSAGTVTISDSSLAAGDHIDIGRDAPAGTIGFLDMPVRTNGTGFTITSYSAVGVTQTLDTSVVWYQITHQN